MSLPPPKPIPTSSPSTTPYAVSIASLQTHVQQLTSSNQEIETRLQESEAKVQAVESDLASVQNELAVQKDKAQKDLSRISNQYRKERSEWKSGSDALQVVHNVSHLRTSCLLNEERLARWDAEDAQRRQRVAILVRDHRITLFRVKERDLESRISSVESELEQELADYNTSRAEIIAQHRSEIEDLTTQLETTTSELASRVDISKTEKKTRIQLESDIANLRKRCEELGESHQASLLKLDTTEAEFTAAKAKIKEYEAEKKSRDADLRRLQRAEEKDASETENLTREKVALELQVRHITLQVEELETKVVEAESKYKLEKKRASKLQESLESVQENLDRTREELLKAEKNARKQIAESKESSGSKSKKSSSQTHSAVTREKPAVPSSPVVPIIVEDDDEDSVDSPPKAPKASTKPKAPRKRQPEPENNAITDDFPQTKKAKSNGKGKRKAVTPIEISNDEDISDARNKRQKLPKAKPAKPASSAKSSVLDKRKTTEAASDDEDEGQTGDSQKAKKKRKINLLSGGTSSSWNWGNLGNDDTLGIPTEISPVKGAIPARSQFGGTKAKAPSGMFPRP